MIIRKENIADLFYNVMYSDKMDAITRKFENDIVKVYNAVNEVPDNAYGPYDCSEAKDKPSLARALVNNLEGNYFCEIVEALEKEAESWED